MPQRLFTLTQAAHMLGVRPHVLVYALVSATVPEPPRVGNRRMFTDASLARIADVLGKKGKSKKIGRQS